MRPQVLAIVIVSLGSLASTGEAGEPTKMSVSKVCHSPLSPYYHRLKRFTSYNSVQDCLAAGGRLPKSGNPAKKQELPSSSYQRSAFGAGWADIDGDCQDSRQEILAQKSTTPPKWDAKGCRVDAGQWVSFFSGDRLNDPRAIDIDHIVPLKWAWNHGAATWKAGKREKFANDPRNLEPVEARLNRSKGAKGPLKWLPPKNGCSYVARFKRITRTYELALSDQEERWFTQKLASCRR